MRRQVIRCTVIIGILLGIPLSALPQDFAVRLDGVDDFINVPHNSSFDWNMQATIECWVKINQSHPGAMFNKWMSGYEDKHLVMNDEQRIAFHLHGPGYPGQFRYSRSVLTVDQWTHISGTCRGDSIFIYFNGLLDTAWAVSGSPIGNSTSAARIGGIFRDGSWRTPIDGEIDELRIWSVFKTPQEVRQGMFQKALGTEPGLVAAWHFDEGQGQMANDVSPNANHGTFGNNINAEPEDPQWVVSTSPLATGSQDFGLVGYWSFDDGTANDNSGNGNVGVVYGATPVQGVSGQGLSFDGVDDYVEVPDDESLRPGTITLSAWVNVVNPMDLQKIVGKSQYSDATKEQYALGILSDGRAEIAVKRQSECLPLEGWYRARTNAAMPANRWCHLVGTWDGEAVRVYVNGQLHEANASAPDGFLDDCSGGSLRFGLWWVDFADRFEGMLDEIRIYERALSESEIVDLYNSVTIPTFCDGFTSVFCDDFESGVSSEWTKRGDCTWDVVDGAAHASVTGVNAGCAMSVGDDNWTDYILEFDVRGNTGYNKAVTFRENLATEQWYGVNIRSDWEGIDELYVFKGIPGGGTDVLALTQFPSENGVWYHVAIQCIGDHIIVSVNGQEALDVQDVSSPYLAGGIGFLCWSGASGDADVCFDNVTVTDPFPRFVFDETARRTVGQLLTVSGRVTFSDGSAYTPLAGGTIACEDPISRCSRTVEVTTASTFSVTTLYPSSYPALYDFLFSANTNGLVVRRHLFVPVDDEGDPGELAVETSYPIRTGSTNNYPSANGSFCASNVSSHSRGDIDRFAGEVFESSKVLGPRFSGPTGETVVGGLTGWHFQQCLFGPLSWNDCYLTASLSAKSVKDGTPEKESYRQAFDKAWAAAEESGAITPTHELFLNDLWKISALPIAAVFTLYQINRQNEIKEAGISAAMINDGDLIAPIVVRLKTSDMGDEVTEIVMTGMDEEGNEYSVTYYSLDFTHSTRVISRCPVDLVITDPQSRVVSKTQNEIPSAEYGEYDFDGDGKDEDQVLLPGSDFGLYSVQVVPDGTAQPTDSFSVFVESSFYSERLVLAENELIVDIPLDPYRFTLFENLPPETFGLIAPDGGIYRAPFALQFSWETTIDPNPGHEVHYDLILATDSGFADSVVINDVQGTQYDLASSLLGNPPNAHYFWKVRARDAWSATTFSTETFQFTATGPTCCAGRVGDANGQGDYPDEVTLGDIMLMVDVKFISGDCSKIPCVAEADVNQDGGANPTCEDHVTLGDIMSLVDFLFITGPDVAVLPDCL